MCTPRAASRIVALQRGKNTAPRPLSAVPLSVIVPLHPCTPEHHTSTTPAPTPAPPAPTPAPLPHIPAAILPTIPEKSNFPRPPPSPGRYYSHI